MSVTVVKLGGRAQSDPGVAGAIAAMWRRAPRSVCVVHGGGDELSALQRSLGVEPRFEGGRRVTSEQDVELARMALSGSANKRLVAAVAAAGAPAFGLSGEDGRLIEADPRGLEHLGRVGKPSRIATALLENLLNSGLLPVISPVAADATGTGALNVNGDDAAAAIAGALHAAELLFVSDVGGVLNSSSEPLGQVDAAHARLLAGDGAVSGGMLAKIEAAESALAAGVGRVRIGDSTMLRESDAGTTITMQPEAMV